MEPKNPPHPPRNTPELAAEDMEDIALKNTLRLTIIEMLESKDLKMDDHLDINLELTISDLMATTDVDPLLVLQELRASYQAADHLTESVTAEKAKEERARRFEIIEEKIKTIYDNFKKIQDEEYSVLEKKLLENKDQDPKI